MPKSSKPLTWVDQELTNDNLPKNIKLNIELLLGEEDLKPKRKGTELPKRSMNAFFIYRKALDKELKNRGYYDLRMREKVKLAGMLWKSENREVKEICQQLASKAKNLLEQELNSTTNYFTPTSQPESSFSSDYALSQYSSYPSYPSYPSDAFYLDFYNIHVHVLDFPFNSESMQNMPF